MELSVDGRIHETVEVPLLTPMSWVLKVELAMIWREG